MRFRTGMTLWDHADRMHQWLQMTRVFYLTGQQLLAHTSLTLNDAYDINNSSEIQRCEFIRTKVDAVLADDGGHCRPLTRAKKLKWFKKSHSRVHYEMFEVDIARPLREASWKNDIPLRPATRALMKAMKKGFGKSIEEGFAWILIVELIAKEIVEEMHKYLVKIKKGWRRFFTKEQLFYCTYHILLEKLHSEDVREAIRLVADTPERFELLKKEVLSALILWYHFFWFLGFNRGAYINRYGYHSFPIGDFGGSWLKPWWISGITWT